jgi:hypothetical protein
MNREQMEEILLQRRRFRGKSYSTRFSTLIAFDTEHSEFSKVLAQQLQCRRPRRDERWKMSMPTTFASWHLPSTRTYLFAVA